MSTMIRQPGERDIGPGDALRATPGVHLAFDRCARRGTRKSHPRADDNAAARMEHVRMTATIPTPRTSSSNDGGEPPPSSRRDRRGATAPAVLAAAVLGAGALAAILFATGAIHGSTTSAGAQAATAGPADGSGSLHPTALYAGAAPGVVDITARSTTTVASPLGPSRQQSTSSGAGIVVDRQGHILTADHVVRGSSSVSITLSNGASRSARIAGSDPATDLAVLSVDPSGLSLHALVLGDSAALQVGDPVAAIGDP